MTTWETMAVNPILQRTRVPGGWLYRTESQTAVALAYVQHNTFTSAEEAETLP